MALWEGNESDLTADGDVPSGFMSDLTFCFHSNKNTLCVFRSLAALKAAVELGLPSNAKTPRLISSTELPPETHFSRCLSCALSAA